MRARVPTITELLADSGADNELSETTKAYRAGLDALFAGAKATAVSNLESVVDDQPTNEFAKKYLDKAKELPDPPKEESSFPLVPMLIGLGGLVLAVIAGAALFLVKRRGKRASSPVVPAGQMTAPVAGTPAWPMSAPVTPAPSTPASPMPAPATPASTTPAETMPGNSGDPAVGGSNGAGNASDQPIMLVTPPAPTTLDPSGAVAAEPPPVAVAEESDRKLFCGNCGAGHEAGQKFCKECGSSL